MKVIPVASKMSAGRMFVKKMMTLLFPLQGKGGNRTEENPSPPCRNVVFEVVSVLTSSAKFDISAISGINGVTTPMKKLAMWMYLMWCFVSQSRALIGNHIFQKREAASMNHHSATERVLYTCTIPIRSAQVI